MKPFNSRSVGQTAIAITILFVLGIITLALLYSGFPFFGPVNDLINAAIGIMCGVLAWAFHALLRERTQAAGLYLLAAWAGVAALFVNSILVAFGQMHWMTGGMYSGIGYGLLGVWLLALSLKVLPGLFEKPLLARLGVITAAAMLCGLLAGPFMGLRVNFNQNLLVAIAYSGAALGFLLFPIWTWLLGRRLLNKSPVDPSADTETPLENPLHSSTAAFEEKIG